MEVITVGMERSKRGSLTGMLRSPEMMVKLEGNKNPCPHNL